MIGKLIANLKLIKSGNKPTTKDISPGEVAIFPSSDKKYHIFCNAGEDGIIDMTDTALPNPQSLTFTGAVNASYDGSRKVSVEIPNGATQPLFIDFYYDESQSKIVTDSTITLEEMKEIIQKRTVYCRYINSVLTLVEIGNDFVDFFYYFVSNPANPTESFTWSYFSLQNHGWTCEFKEL